MPPPFIALDWGQAKPGSRQVRGGSAKPVAKDPSSPYHGLNLQDSASVVAQTLSLLQAYPATSRQVVDAVLASWNALQSSQIGRARIGVHVFPTPQVLGAFLHELVPLEMAAISPGQWRPDVLASEKDLVYVPDDAYSTEIKTSKSPQRIFGNRSFGQVTTGVSKKLKSGYYIAVNFTPWERDGQDSVVPRVHLIRVGWLDHSDWIGQAAESGQAAGLGPQTENTQLLTIYSDR